jgi:hypothetical protein
VSFTVMRCDVVVHGDGTVVVTPPDGVRGEGRTHGTD